MSDAPQRVTEVEGPPREGVWLGEVVRERTKAPSRVEPERLTTSEVAEIAATRVEP